MMDAQDFGSLRSDNQAAPTAAHGPRRPRSPEERLVHQALPLVNHLARGLGRRWGRCAEVEELAAAGRLALVELVRAYDPERAPFAPYASRRLEWAMRDALRRHTHSRTAASRVHLNLAEGRGASDADLDSNNGLAPTELVAAQSAELDCFAVGSPVVAAGDMEAVRDPSDTPEQHVLRRREEQRIRGAVQALPERERALVQEHYFRGERLDRAAAALGISKSWASRLHARAIARLGEALQLNAGPKRMAPLGRACGSAEPRGPTSALLG